MLPFTCIGADPDQEVFAEGMTEDVIAHLAKVRALDVISRASVMPFKDRRDVLERVGRVLRATAVLDGSVRISGSRVRIVATLIDVATGRELWVETYDRDLTDIFTIQSDVAVRIAEALRAKLTPDEGKRMHRQPTADLAAYGLYLQGRRHFLRYTYEGMHRSAALFQGALDRDPAFADASTLLAMANINLAEHGFEPAAALYERAAGCVARALELEPESGDAHATDGYLRLLSNSDWDAALAGLKRGLELSPGSAYIHDVYARILMLMERYDEALEHAIRAQQLDPLAHRNDLTTILLRAGRHDEALHHAQDAVEADPSSSRAHATLGWAYLLSGRSDEGVAALERAVGLDPDNDLWRGQLGQAYARSGQDDKARAVLAEMEGPGAAHVRVAIQPGVHSRRTQAGRSRARLSRAGHGRSIRTGARPAGFVPVHRGPDASPFRRAAAIDRRDALVKFRFTQLSTHPGSFAFNAPMLPHPPDARVQRGHPNPGSLMTVAGIIRSMGSSTYRAVLWPVLAGVALAACQPGAPETPSAGVTLDTVGILASIDSLAGRVMLSNQAGDAEGFASTWAADGIMSVAGTPPAVGRDAIVAAFRARPPLPAGASMTIHPTEIRVLSADWAYVMGVDTLRVTPPGAAEPVIETFTFLVLLKKGAEGWQSYREVLTPHQAMVREVGLATKVAARRTEALPRD